MDQELSPEGHSMGFGQCLTCSNGSQIISICSDLFKKRRIVDAFLTPFSYLRTGLLLGAYLIAQLICHITFVYAKLQ